MSLTRSMCPICKEPATYVSRNTDDDRFYRCPDCGDYDIPTACVHYLEKYAKDKDLADSMRNRTKNQAPVFTPVFKRNSSLATGYDFHLPTDTTQK